MGDDRSCVSDLGNGALPVSLQTLFPRISLPPSAGDADPGYLRYLFFMYGKRIRGMSKFAAGR